MNYMKDAAKILGVELEEEFKIKGFEPIYKITNYGLVIKTDSNNWYGMSGDTFLQLIRGDYVIRKLPWQPKKAMNIIIQVKALIMFVALYGETLFSVSLIKKLGLYLKPMKNVRLNCLNCGKSI